MFVDEPNSDFRLQPGSHCIDACDPAPQFNDPDGFRNDMGAFGGPLAPAVITGVEAQDDAEIHTLYHNRPNPF